MTPDTSIYTDLQGFTSLRARAQQDPNAAMDTVAEQFESIFVQMMVKSMRDASEPFESDWAGSSQMKSYQQMFDQQLSLDLSRGGGLGLAEVLVRQLSGAEDTENANSMGSVDKTAEFVSLDQYRMPQLVSATSPDAMTSADPGSLQPLNIPEPMETGDTPLQTCQLMI